MEITVWRIAAVVFALLFCFQWEKNRKARQQMKRTAQILDDVLEGNLDRRILDDEHSLTAQVCYKINQIVMAQKRDKIAQGKAEQSYRQLATSLSHDLRTPLASLSGYLEALEGDLVEPEERPFYLQTALKKADELKEYVDILFEWMKLESGERSYDFQSQDLCEVTREVLIPWMLSMIEAGFELVVDLPEEEKMVWLDRESYTRMIGNLLQNILRHSQGNWCGICFEEIDGWYQITVSDNGRGIPGEHIEEVFVRLYKGDASRNSGGSGLGLSIVWELVKAHGGHIYARSVPWKRTDFVLRLPKTAAK